MPSSRRFLALLAAPALIAVSACNSSAAADAPQEPAQQRVVALSFAGADTLSALGKTDLVVGVPKSGVLPEALSEYADPRFADVGTLKEPKLDVIAESAPTILLNGSRTAEMTGEFEKVADQVVAADPDTTDLVANNRRSAEEVAALVGGQDRVGAELAEIDTAVAAAKEKASGAGTGLVLMVSGGKVTAFGAGSRFDVIFNEIGLKPATELPADNRHGAAMSWEQIAEINPDHIFVLDRDSAVGSGGQSAEQVLDNPVFQQTKAATSGNVHQLDGQNWYLVGGGLDVLEEMVNEVGEALS